MQNSGVKAGKSELRNNSRVVAQVEAYRENLIGKEIVVTIGDQPKITQQIGKMLWIKMPSK